MPLAFASSPVAPYALATKVEGRIAMLCFQLDQRSEAIKPRSAVGGQM